MTRLLADIEILQTTGDLASADVADVQHDSRRVGPGDLFSCLRGTAADGHRFAAAAVRKGAVGLLCERFVPDAAVPQARVAPGAARHATALAAAAVHGYPARQLLTVGVTGTNAKTTVAHLLGAVLAPAEVIGTLTGTRTTPESTDLQRRLAQVLDERGRGAAVALEVSSHALVQSRVDGIVFDAAVFTNLSHDHLDYHGTMEAYFAAKASLFTPERARLAVINADDPWGRRLLAGTTVPAVPVSRSSVRDVCVTAGRSTFVWRDQRVTVPLSGLVNVDNALLAAETAVALGRSPEEVAARLAAVPPIPGRLELVAAPPACPFSVLVDYAHTPAGLELVLADARRLAAGHRVLVVFGCGGSRDREKRPLMGAAAARLADVAVLTSDNPRSEDPLAIIAEVAAGDAAGRLVVEPDRRAAIAGVLAAAGAGDVVVVAGKGHETTQQLAGATVPFDDRSVVAELLGDG